MGLWPLHECSLYSLWFFLWLSESGSVTLIECAGNALLECFLSPVSKPEWIHREVFIGKAIAVVPFHYYGRWKAIRGMSVYVLHLFS